MNLQAGSIDYNTTEKGGAGIHYEGNDNIFKLSGNPVIEGNAQGGTISTNENGFSLNGGDANNLYLANNNIIEFTGALNNTKPIGVTLQENAERVFTSSTGSVKASDYRAKFTSDNRDYEVLTVDKELKLGVHTHNFVYTEGTGDKINTITATCTTEGCPLDSIVLTLNKPESLVYDGTAKEAAITGYPETVPVGLAAAPTAITYYKSNGEGSTDKSGEALPEAPTNAGSYVAQVIWGGKTASLGFTIAKAVQTITANNVTATYGDTDNIAELTYQISGDYVEGDDLGVIVSTDANSTSPVGEYDINVDWNGNPNYTATLNNGKYTIIE